MVIWGHQTGRLCDAEHHSACWRFPKSPEALRGFIIIQTSDR